MLISVITASYNYAQYLPQTIDSVLNQTYKDWELIIVDDGSSDDSVEVIKTYIQKDSRIKLYTHNEGQNKGLVETLRLGVEKSRGEWIAFLESDDIWRDDCLEKRVNAINENSNFNLIFNNVKLFGDPQKVNKMQNVVNYTTAKLIRKNYPHNMFYDFGVDNLILTFSAVMAKRNILEFWDCPFDKLFDWWLYIQLSYENKFLFLNEPLTNWRIHSDSYINSSSCGILPQFRAYLDVYKRKRNRKLLLKIFWIFIIYIISFKAIKTLKTKIARKIKNLK